MCLACVRAVGVFRTFAVFRVVFRYSRVQGLGLGFRV